MNYMYYDPALFEALKGFNSMIKSNIAKRRKRKEKLQMQSQ